MDYTREQLAALNKTARAWPSPPLVYRFLAKHYLVPGEPTVLDYGCGPGALWTDWLSKKGFYTMAYDIGRNAGKMTNPNALDYHYNYVVASNVLNIQPDLECICGVLEELRKAATTSVLLNYPCEPRKTIVTTKEMLALCKLAFGYASLHGTLIIGEMKNG